jgi:DNA-binding MarR family transcriptional regulator
MNTEFHLDHTLGYLINRCAILLKSELTHRFRQAGYDVTPEEWSILNRLWEQDGLSQNELAERTIKDKTTVTRFLNQMESKRLVIRRSSKEDGRTKKVHLTSRGQELKPILIQITKGLLAEASIDLPETNLKTTFNTLKTVENNLLRLEKLNR